MYQYKELSGLTRATIATLWVYLVSKLLVALGEFYSVVVVGEPLSAGLLVSFGLAAMTFLLSMVVAFILIGWWTYRANANAHVLAGGDLTISAGWAVGWYFIPFANLVQPYIAMKETWLASHYRGDWGVGETPVLLPLWWGLWIVSGVLGELVYFTRKDSPVFSAEAGFVSGVLTVALSLILIRIIKRIRDAQKDTRHADIFA
jgi:hypothetical protein